MLILNLLFDYISENTYGNSLMLQILVLLVILIVPFKVIQSVCQPFY